MGTKNQMDETYNYMDKLWRLTYGEMADISGAMYNGDFSKTVEQAQKDKHEYILNGLGIEKGSRVLDIGCGWGGILKSVKERGGQAIGVTLSNKHAESCKRNGLEAYVMDYKDMDVDTFGKFDAVISIGAFEHFCSVEEYLAGKQDQVYHGFFKLCYDLLPEGGGLFLQTMMWGENVPDYRDISLKAKRGSDEYVLAIMEKFFPGSWLPDGEEHIIRCAEPFFEVVSLNNGRLDYLQTMKDRDARMFKEFSIRKLFAMMGMVKHFFMDKDFIYKLESLRGRYNRVVFERKLFDHQRIILKRN